MRENPPYCFPHQSLQEAAELMQESDRGELPVVNNDEERYPVGLMTARDLVVRSLGLGRDPFDLTVEDCMTSPAITLPEEATRGQLYDTMEEHGVRHVIVVNLRGSLCGIVTQGDVGERGMPTRSSQPGARSHERLH